MILVCGGVADSVTELVCARLSDCGYPYRLLDLGVYPAGYAVKWHWRGGYPVGYIACADWRLDIAELTGVYLRFLGAEGRVPIHNLAPGDAAAMYAEYDIGLSLLFEELPCVVVNRLRGGMSNYSKPYQSLQIIQCGLNTPPTLVTNDPLEAGRFYEEHGGEVIYKSLSGIRSIVRRLEAEQLTRLPFLRYGPAQFQGFIPGENVRVHTVGDEVFATRVRSEAVDYRYARREGYSVEMEPTELPPHITAACLRLARRLGLLFTGIDLKETPEGEYYCFEVNPSPGFLFYEQGTGQPISKALADLLHQDASFLTEGHEAYAGDAEHLPSA